VEACHFGLCLCSKIGCHRGSRARIEASMSILRADRAMSCVLRLSSMLPPAAAWAVSRCGAYFA